MRKWIPMLLVIAATLASMLIYSRLPEQVPTHWNMEGEADDWSSRFFGAWLMPLMMAVILVVLRLVPHIDPRRANYEKFRGAYEAIVILTMAFMLGLHLMLLAVATGVQVSLERVLPGAVGAFFIAIGVLLPRAHPNWFVGIRTPWTLTSDVVWEKTHKFGGILFTASGALTVAAALVAPRAATWVLIATGTVTAISVVAYSFVVWKRDKESRSVT